MTAAIFFILALLLQASAGVPAGIPIQAELTKEVTTRRSKPGQQVQLVTSDDVRGADGAVLIPAGARLTGKLSIVRKHSGDDPAVLAFLIDKAEWKGGSMPLNASLQQMLAIGQGSDAGSCGPNLNRGSLPSGCRASGGNVQAVPADCKVDKVDENMAFVCQKREIELGPGTVVVLRNADTAKP